MDTQIVDTIEVPQHRRNESFDIPNETLLIGHFKSQPATTDEDHDEEHDEIESTNDDHEHYEEEEEKDGDVMEIREYTNNPLPRSALRRKTILVHDVENFESELATMTGLDTVQYYERNGSVSYQPPHYSLDNIQLSSEYFCCRLIWI